MDVYKDSQGRIVSVKHTVWGIGNWPVAILVGTVFLIMGQTIWLGREVLGLDGMWVMKVCLSVGVLATAGGARALFVWLRGEASVRDMKALRETVEAIKKQGFEDQRLGEGRVQLRNIDIARWAASTNKWLEKMVREREEEARKAEMQKLRQLVGHAPDS